MRLLARRHCLPPRFTADALAAKDEEYARQQRLRSAKRYAEGMRELERIAVLRR